MRNGSTLALMESDIAQLGAHPLLLQKLGLKEGGDMPQSVPAESLGLRTGEPHILNSNLTLQPQSFSQSPQVVSNNNYKNNTYYCDLITALC